MKKVLQVLGSLQRGGAETLVMNIYRNIDYKKIQFDFIVRENVIDGYEEEVKKMGGRIFVVPSPKKIGLKKCIKMHIDVMKKNGPYIAVHSHINAMSFISMIAAKKSKINIRISHSHNTSFPGKIKSLIGSRLTKKYSTKLLACSNDAGKKLFGNSKFEVIQNGIIIENFIINTPEDNEKIKKKLKMNTEKLNICHIGRYVEQKNHEFIILLGEALKKQKIPFNIYLLGAGPKFEKIKKMIIEKNLEKQIHMMGSIKNANEYLKACDLMILPSYFEGFPVTLVEAQAAGIPAIVSNTITKNVDFGLNLIKFLPLDINEWVKIIKDNNYLRLYNSSKIINTITENKYNIKDTVNKITKIYNSK